MGKYLRKRTLCCKRFELDLGVLLNNLKMTMFGRVGGFLQQNIRRNTSVIGHVSGTNMFNVIRCMSTKLFIGNLSYGTDDQTLRDAFASFGEVTEAKIIVDRDTGRSRGFGFVDFTTDESASQAMSSMDGQDLNGRNIRVSVANERPAAGSFQGGYRGGGGGYN